jgi:hypothetical protein
MKKVPEIISFHPGRQHNFEQAFELAKLGFKFKHVTTLFFSQNTIAVCSKVSKRFARALKKRTSDLKSVFVDTNPFPEMKLVVYRDILRNASPYHYRVRNKEFQQWIIRNYSPPKICIGFDTSSWLVFEQWKERTVLVLDLSIAVPQYKLHLAKEYGVQNL